MSSFVKPCSAPARFTWLKFQSGPVGIWKAKAGICFWNNAISPVFSSCKTETHLATRHITSNRTRLSPHKHLPYTVVYTAPRT